MPPHMDMTKIIPPPDRETIEREIHSLFKNGDLSDIARLLQKDQSLISKEFNPYSDEKHNVIFGAMVRLWAMDAIRPDLAPEIINIVLRERQKWLPARVPAECPARLTGNLMKEVGEMIEAEIAGLDFDKQIKEINDVIRVAKEKEASVIAQRNVKYFGGSA